MMRPALILILQDYFYIFLFTDSLTHAVCVLVCCVYIYLFLDDKMKMNEKNGGKIWNILWDNFKDQDFGAPVANQIVTGGLKAKSSLPVPVLEASYS